MRVTVACGPRLILTAKEATLVGVVANELVTNAVKHADAPRWRGTRCAWAARSPRSRRAPKRTICGSRVADIAIILDGVAGADAADLTLGAHVPHLAPVSERIGAGEASLTARLPGLSEGRSLAGELAVRDLVALEQLVPELTLGVEIDRLADAFDARRAVGNRGRRASARRRAARRARDRLRARRPRRRDRIGRASGRRSRGARPCCRRGSCDSTRATSQISHRSSSPIWAVRSRRGSGSGSSKEGRPRHSRSGGAACITRASPRAW